ncbi:Syntaxin-binding protein 2 [Zancudomyces culisetae]|uniref:Syntaxin-binding protein 2 n=1 Tax=Zancudomyces culisetae TaxID=1213189 RepID=A0A1R1PE90_ZANCU|nr:Syntaxin-binding protein 2 [Zancudomyces culisetae]|eukprot:OMH79315.1 Syntaxin-binding protein 2 [Zancudomyces culisetae]
MDENSLKVLLRTRILEAVRSVKPPGKWKIVVVDKHSLKLISSVLKLYDLLEEDVSIVETITKSRQPFTDREAVYFLSPTKESVSRFIDDFTKKGPGWNKGAMYAGAHLFFTTGMV